MALHPGDCNGHDCRLCWLAAHDARYQRLWGITTGGISPNAGDAPPARLAPTPAIPTTPCTHLGPSTGETAQCPTCRGMVQLKLFACDIHGTCTTHKPAAGYACCIGCKDYTDVVSSIGISDASGDTYVSPEASPNLGALLDTPASALPDGETQAILAAIAEDEARLAKASGKEKSRYKRAIAAYRQRLGGMGYSKPLTWQTGLTTVPSRRKTLLPRTLASLRNAGFDCPRLFVDGEQDAASWQHEFGLDVSVRAPTIKTYGNWILALQELFIREPRADRYALFQDDFVTYTNLRAYLESCPFPDRGYWNLYTFPDNQKVCPKDKQGKEIIGWYEANQRGRGAVALVFNQAGVLALLAHRPLIERPLSPPPKTWASVDGGIVTAMNKEGFREWCHNPSLVQHVGDVSAMKVLNAKHGHHPKAPSFRSESFDAAELIR